METWIKVWRQGIVPQFTTSQLLALRRGLLNDDPRLIQGATTSPPPLQCTQDWKCEAGCGVSYPVAFEDDGDGDSQHTVGYVEERFARMCFECDRIMQEPASCRWFLNFFDETPRDEMRRRLLEEVDLALTQRDKDTSNEPDAVLGDV